MSIKNHKLLSLSLAVIFLAVGCSSNKQQALEKKQIEQAEGREVTKSASVEAEASKYVEIKFNSGSSMLTERAKASLSSLVKSPAEDSKIDEIIVLSWSDEEYPSKSLGKLPRMQKDLAKKRNANVESYVKSMRDVSISTYNMAERPTTLAKLFDTEDAQLKSSLVAAGLTTTADPATYANKASHSVILVKIK